MDSATLEEKQIKTVARRCLFPVTGWSRWERLRAAVFQRLSHHAVERNLPDDDRGVLRRQCRASWRRRTSFCAGLLRARRWPGTRQ